MNTFLVTLTDYKGREWPFVVTSDQNALDDYLENLERRGYFEKYSIKPADNYAGSLSAFSQLLVTKGIA